MAALGMLSNGASPQVPTSDEQRHIALLADPAVDNEVWLEHLNAFRDLMPPPLIISGLHVSGLRERHDAGIAIAPWDETRHVLVID
jgi:hypothetical protein